MSTLKEITTKAKALYKTGKYKKWTDAIKAASKQTATVGATKKKAAKKKSAPKKLAKKKAPARNYGSHKDTNSHNVKISVMSGIKTTYTIKDFKFQSDFLTSKDKQALITFLNYTNLKEGIKYAVINGKTYLSLEKLDSKSYRVNKSVSNGTTYLWSNYFSKKI